jgi:putative transposase
MADMQIITYRYRVKDKHAKALDRMARACNVIWNYCNDTQKHALKWNTKWLSGFDLNKLTAGAGKELGLHSGTVNAVCEQYAKSRRKSNRPYLRYRGKKSLGWIPFKGRDYRAVDDSFYYSGIKYNVWLSRQLPAGAKIKDGGSFARDSQGRWYVNIPAEIPVSSPREATFIVGIDLGLKDIATLSTGEKVAAPQFYRKMQKRLSKAQRAKKKGLARRIHARIVNQRRDFLHKITTNIVRRYDVIYVGNVSSSQLAKTRMAKSVMDASWYSLRVMLAYKSIANGVQYRTVNEAYSTQTCSECGSIGGPKGRKGLVIRQWQCACGAVHDRDVNAARVIARYGHVSP